MSLLWPERLVAVLDPRGATLARGAAWGGPLELVGDQASAGSDAGWRGAADALATLLATRGEGRGALTVVLSSHFVRFCLVPWSEAIGTPEELQSYARLSLEEIYGTVEGGWSLRVSSEPSGRARLAAGIEEALLARLAALAAGAGLRLASVQPYLMAAFNRLAGKFRHGDFVFLLAEPGRSTLLGARKGGWASVSSSAGSDTDEALSALIARESELQGAAGHSLPPVYVHAPARSDCAPRSGGGAAPVALAIRAGGGVDPRFTMAMAASR